MEIIKVIRLQRYYFYSNCQAFHGKKLQKCKIACNFSEGGILADTERFLKNECNILIINYIYIIFRFSYIFSQTPPLKKSECNVECCNLKGIFSCPGPCAEK